MSEREDEKDESESTSEPLGIEPPAPARWTPKSWADRSASDRLLAIFGAIFLLAVAYTLYIARSLVVPVLFALLASALFEPLVQRLSRFLPRLLSAALVILAFVGCLVFAGWRSQEPVARLLEDLPRRARVAESHVERLLRPIEPVQQATEHVQEIAENLNESTGASKKEVVQVQTEPAMAEALMGGLRQFLLSAAVLFALMFFLLGSDHQILAKLLRLAPQFESREDAEVVATRIESDLARYLATITGINLGLGASVALVLYLFGVPSPIFWGVMAAMMNFIPYVGMTVMIVLLTLTTSMSAEHWTMAVFPVLTYAALTIIEGTFITPLAVGRRLELSPVAIFAGIIFWGWMWGILGVLLAVPLLMATKIVCVHVAPDGPVADLLSG